MLLSDSNLKETLTLMADIRSFIALNCIHKDSLALIDLQQRLQKFINLNNITWHIPEKLHLTLRFFEKVTEDEVSQLKQIVSHWETRVITLPSRQLSTMPQHQPRVLSLNFGLTEPLAALYADLTS